MRVKLLPLLLSVCFGMGSPIWAFNVSYSDGVADYENGRYQSAVVNLAKGVGAEPGNAFAHYYLANALVKCGDHKQALDEYRSSLMLEPTGSVSVFCRAALKGYRMPLPTMEEAQSYRDTVGGAHAVHQTMTAIRKQLDGQRQNTEELSKTLGKDALNRGSYDMNKVDSWAKEEISNLYSPNRHMRDPRLLDEEFVKQREAAIRISAKDEQERIRREAAETALRYKRNGEQRQKLLDDSARALEKQMTEKPGNSGVRLVAEGTDLYVRRYVSVKTAHPLPDARAAVVRIYGRGANSDANPNPEITKDGPTSDTHARTVSGKVLN
jgi:tetratricopeptide (TPR) repeat protein